MLIVRATGRSQNAACCVVCLTARPFQVNEAPTASPFQKSGNVTRRVFCPRRLLRRTSLCGSDRVSCCVFSRMKAREGLKILFCLSGIFVESEGTGFL